LHPGYKGQYFIDHKWKQVWIDVAKELVRYEWQTYYKPANSSTAPAGHSSSNQARQSAPADAHAGPVTIDPLEAYLASPPLEQVTDPIAYWNAMLGNETEAPLARMALDFLSVPGAS
ncbi:hypothetical protein C8Q76DRAFT_592953, partial [Earliella scabrosa]